MKSLITSVAVILTLQVPSAWSADESVLADALAEHMEFSEYAAGILVPEQLPPADLANFTVIDARDAGQFAEGHLPGAVNIEWREIVSRRGEISKDKPVLVYCNTGTLSSRASFALRLLGYNALVLQEGREGWLKRYPQAGQ